MSSSIQDINRDLAGELFAHEQEAAFAVEDHGAEPADIAAVD